LKVLSSRFSVHFRQRSAAESQLKVELKTKNKRREGSLVKFRHCPRNCEAFIIEHLSNQADK